MPFLLNFKFLYFRENWTWIKLAPTTRQNMWQTHQKTRERETKNRYLVSIQIMVIIYWAVFITHCSITHKKYTIQFLNWKHVLKSRFQFKNFKTQILTSKHNFSSRNNLCTVCATMCLLTISLIYLSEMVLLMHELTRNQLENICK